MITLEDLLVVSWLASLNKLALNCSGWLKTAFLKIHKMKLLSSPLFTSVGVHNKGNINFAFGTLQ